MTNEYPLAKIGLDTSVDQLNKILKTFVNKREEAKKLSKKMPKYSRQGRGGDIWSYHLKGHTRNLLDKLYQGAWDFQVISISYQVSEVIVHARLRVSLDSIARTFDGIGSGELKFYSSGENQGKPISVGDAAKSAETDAFKKCAEWLGIGADVYEIKETEMAEAQEIAYKYVISKVPKNKRDELMTSLTIWLANQKVIERYPTPLKRVKAWMDTQKRSKKCT